MLLALVACSAKESEKAKSDDTAKENSSAEMRTIDTVLGKVEVPSNPQRVIVDWNVGHVLALGVEPVGVSSTIMEYNKMLAPYIPKSAEGIGAEGQISFEKVIELKPDLIITFNQDAVEQYEKIAPTVLFNTKNYASKEEEITAMADILNAKEAGEAFLADMEKRIAIAKADLEKVVPTDATFTIINSSAAKNVVVEVVDGGGAAIYELLGLPMPETLQQLVKDSGETRLNISWEKVDEYVGDYVFKLYSGDGEASSEQLPAVWNNLQAVKDNHVIDLDFEKYFMSDPISNILQVEEMTNKIIDTITQNKE